MKLPTMFNPSARTAETMGPAAETRPRAFRAGLFSAKVRPEAEPRIPRQAQPSDSKVFQEAGTRRGGGLGGFLSSAGRFMTGAHPDHIRNRAEAVGDTFARRVDRFEQGKGGGLGGPLFGMGFKSYDSPRPAAAPGPFGAAAPAPFASPADSPAFRQQAHQAGADFAARMNAFERPNVGTPGPFAGMAGAQPFPGPRAATAEFGQTAPGQPAQGPAAPPPVNTQAFARYVQEVGNDFANRVSAFERAGGGAANPFQGMAGVATAAPAPAPAATPAAPAPAVPAPADNQTRIDAARAEYRSMMTRLTSDLSASKDRVELDAANQISVATARNEDIGRNLDRVLRDVEASGARETESLKQEIKDMQQQLKDLARQMRPVQAQAFAGGTDSRNERVLDRDTAAGRDQFTQLSHERNQIKERIALAEDRLTRIPAETAGLRADLMRQAEDEIAGNDVAIGRIKANRTRALEGLDKGFASARAFEMDRIASTHGVAFVPARG
jgi:predicted  nucleic acid-binding Zn-ribbon protein